MVTTGAYLLGPNEGELRCGPGATSTRFKATGDLTGAKFSLVDERAPKGESVPLHKHVDDEESFYVLEGEIEFFLGENAGVRAQAGSFVHIPGGTVHGFRVESDGARYLIFTTARHGDFYRAITRRVQSTGEAFEKVTDAEVSRACRDFNIDYVGPLPALG
ncbi:MAG: cupin domain-containing protein [Candidatus Eisenbacteria bacterium]